MFRSSRVVGVVVLGLVTFAGCGGSKSDEAVYDADATATCLDQAGVTIEKGPGLVAGAGSNTALRGLVGGRAVIVVFFPTASEAKDALGLFDMLDDAAGRRSGSQNRSGNAVMFWKQRAPTKSEQATLRDCLRSH